MICTGWGAGLSACSTVVGDPGFHRGGCQTPRRGPNPLFGIIFAENYMKMKKNWTEAVRGKGMGAPPPRSEITDLFPVTVQGGGGLQTSRSNFFHFHAIFGKILPDNRLTPPPLQLVVPSGKSWIHYWFK